MQRKGGVGERTHRGWCGEEGREVGNGCVCLSEQEHTGNLPYRGAGLENLQIRAQMETPLLLQPPCTFMSPIRAVDSPTEMSESQSPDAGYREQFHYTVHYSPVIVAARCVQHLLGPTYLSMRAVYSASMTPQGMASTKPRGKK